MTRKIAILGSTGSIGTQALDVVRQHPDHFVAHILTAGNNADLLIQQAREFQPDTVVIANEGKYEQVREALANLPIKVYTGSQAICDVVQMDSVDMVLAAMVGFAGLRPTISAIQARKPIALANKETLVVAGEYIMNAVREKQVPLLPVDSEHSAILQCLVGDLQNRVEKILLTASGGPFRTWERERFATITPADALRHPNWHMGPKITVDSATLMNKGLEIIEAMRLYRLPVEQVQAVIHRQSIVHSLVEFRDGALLAQLGTPDMKLPIRYAMTYPHRAESPNAPLDLLTCGALTFDRPDEEAFPCLRLAREAAAVGGTACAIRNAANEAAVGLFLQGKLGFNDIPRRVERALERTEVQYQPSLADILEADRAARRAVLL